MKIVEKYREYTTEITYTLFLPVCHRGETIKSYQFKKNQGEAWKTKIYWHMTEARFLRDKCTL